MPDTTVLPTGGTSGGGGGVNWLLVGAAGVGIVILAMMLRKPGGAGQPTVAAGTSINAALGSIQEQNLNLMGQLGQVGASLGQQIGSVQADVGTTNANVFAARGDITNYGNQIYTQAMAANTQSQQLLQGQQTEYWNLLAALTQNNKALASELGMNRA